MYISLHTPAQSFHPETMSSNKGSSSSKVLPSKEVLPSCDRIISMSNTEICLLTAYKMFPFKRVCAPLPKSIHTASYTHSTCMHNSIILTHRDVQLTASSSKVLSSMDAVLQQKTQPPANSCHPSKSCPVFHEGLPSVKGLPFSDPAGVLSSRAVLPSSDRI